MPIPLVEHVSLTAMLGRAALVAFALCVASPLYAQDCPASSKKGDGADIQCHIDKVLAKHETLTGTMKEKLRGCAGGKCDVLQKQLEKVESARGRAKVQHGRMKSADYETVNKRRKAKCTGAKNCYETPSDFEVTEEEETGAGDDLVAQLDEIGEGLDKTNELLSLPAGASVAGASLRSFGASATFPQMYDYTADPDYPAWLHIADNPKALIPAAFAMTIAAQVAIGIDTVAKDFCQQSILGFNASLACLVTSILAGALDSTAVLLNYNLTDATAWDTHGAYLRAGNLNDNLITVHGGVAAVEGQVGDTQVALVDLESKFTVLQSEILSMNQRLLAFQNQIIQLLLTPEGRRAVPAALLTCDGSVRPCPPVILDCSPTTGLCTFK